MAASIAELERLCQSCGEEHTQLDQVRKCVDQCVVLGLDLNSYTRNLTTPLLTASTRRLPELVAYLLECGADATVADGTDGKTALHLAAEQNDVTSATLLLAHGADPSTGDANGETVLHRLVHNDDSYAAMLKLFVDTGANVMATDKNGYTPLHSAALRKNRHVADVLLGRGADISARDKRGRTPLFIAATEGFGCDLQLVKLLLEFGSDPNACDKDGQSMVELHVRQVTRFKKAETDANTEVLQLLIDHGADVVVNHRPEVSLLHILADNADPPLASFDLLFERGVSINSVNHSGQTALHVMTSKTATIRHDCVELLLSRGAQDSLVIEDTDGNLPLHCLVKTIPTSYESPYATILHDFLKAGADATVRNRDGLSPMSLLLYYCAGWWSTSWGAEEDALYACAQVLCSHGATWDDSCERRLERLHQLWEPATEDDSNDDHSLRETSDSDPVTEQTKAVIAQWARTRKHEPSIPSPLPLISGLRGCIIFWAEERTRGGKDFKFTDIPKESWVRGEEFVNGWLKDVQESTAAQRVSRSKICVVGSSEWGKTSLVKSLTLRKPSLVHVDDRTIGIDLFSCQFQEEQQPEDEAGELDTGTSKTHQSEVAEPKNHEVTFWDFAGQDVYHAAHALFFSKRTLYMLCVDLYRYTTQLSAAQQLSDRDCEVAMRRYAMKHVIKWFETILARQADAEFVLVATKADTVQDQKRIKAVWVDLQIRLGEWREEYASNAVRAKTNDRRAPSHKEVVDKLTRTIHGQWLVVSSVNQASVERAREMTECKVVTCKKGFVMGHKYSGVLRAILDRRTAASHTRSLSGFDEEHGSKTYVEKLIVPSSRLIRDLCLEIEDLEPSECVVILRTLHELGDILWYEHRSAGALRDCVILDPLLVLDIVREVISHEVDGQIDSTANQDESILALRREGRLTHEFLRSRPLWRHLDDELTAAFKSLLQYFQLAYPAHGSEIAYDSDLIVPVYWKLSEPVLDASSLPPLPSIREVAPSEQVYLAWEYVVSSAIASTLFDQFAVQSYSPIFDRTISRQTITSTVNNGEFVSRILVTSMDSNTKAIRIETAASDVDSAWLNMRLFVMMMELVLEEYGGLHVMRDVVQIDNQSGDETRHRVSSTIHDIDTYTKLGKDTTELLTAHPWLASDRLSWFIEKAWRHPGRLQEIQSRAFVRHLLDQANVLQKLVVRGEQGRLYPSLWTAQYDEAKALLTLKMLSDLSGVCYHPSIEISVPAQFWAKHGTVIESGLWVFSNVIPEILTLGLVKKVIDAAAPVIAGTTQRAHAVHSLIDRLDLSSEGVDPSAATSTSLSPTRARALLRELLIVHDALFDELSMSDLSNLQCAVSPSGSYVWAHPQEIKAMGSDKLTPCEPDYSAVVQARQQYEALVKTEVAKGHLKTPSTEPSTIKLALTFEGLGGVSAWDSHKVFCSWRLVHDSKTMPLAVGSTDPNGFKPSDAAATAATGAMVTWSSRKFEVLGVVASVAMLRECRLEVQVKRASRLLGRVKSLGQCSQSLMDVVSLEAASLEPVRLKMSLEISGSTARVTCLIAVAKTPN